MRFAILCVLTLAAADELTEYQRLERAQRASPRDSQITKAWLDESARLATRAAELVEQKRYSEARTLLRATERALAHAPSWNNLLGYAEFKSGNPKPALLYLQKALQLEPDNEDYLLDVGEFLGHHRAYDEAVKVFEVAAKRSPSSPRVQFGLAVAYMMQNRRDLAQERLEKLVTDHPRMEVAYKALGECYEDAGAGDRLVNLGEKLQQVNPRNPLGWYLQGAGLLQTARKESNGVAAALAPLEKSVQLDPGNGRAHFLLARALQESGDDGRAIATLKTTLSLDPAHERAHYVLGRLYQKAGEADLARKELETHRTIKEKDRGAQYQRLLIELR